MNPVRRRKILGIGLSAILLAVVSGLVLYALRQNINVFYSPTQAAQGVIHSNQAVRLGGMVVKGSVLRFGQGLAVRFGLTDYKKTITVDYEGILPDLFREGQGIVVLGHLTDNTHFKATEVLAKHDANYMPPEIKASLAQQSDPLTRAVR